MTLVILLGLAWLALLVWIWQLPKACVHEHARGVANYYDREHSCFVHLKECLDCGCAFITQER